MDIYEVLEDIKWLSHEELIEKYPDIKYEIEDYSEVNEVLRKQINSYYNAKMINQIVEQYLNNEISTQELDDISCHMEDGLGKELVYKAMKRKYNI